MLRFFAMPLGLVALVAVGVHAAVDVVDDRLLAVVEALDVWADSWLAQSTMTAGWVDRMGSVERTLLARAIALMWELVVDLLVVLPLLWYSEEELSESRFAVLAQPTWSSLFKRVVSQPTPMRIARPIAVAAFAVAGAFSVSSLVEGSLFVLLTGHVAAEVLRPLVRVSSLVALVVVGVSLAWRAGLRAVEHGDAVSTSAGRQLRSVWLVGSWGTLAALPLVIALATQVRLLLAWVR